jgi:hypothetical protein
MQALAPAKAAKAQHPGKQPGFIDPATALRCA